MFSLTHGQGPLPGDNLEEGIYTLETLKRLLRFAEAYGADRIVLLDEMQQEGDEPLSQSIVLLRKGEDADDEEAGLWTTIHACVEGHLQ